MDKEQLIGISKTPETAFNNPVVHGTTFRDLVNSFPPAKREYATRIIAQLMMDGFDCLTTKNGDKTFTHEFIPADKDWPNLIE